MQFLKGMHKGVLGDFPRVVAHAARLRELAQPGSGTVVLKTHMGAGHGGSSGRFDALHEVAEEYAFLLAVAEGQPD